MNLNLPERFLQGDESISECLSRLDEETGIQMEIEMRTPHFEALERWLEYAKRDNTLKVMTYDDVFTDNVSAMEELAKHYQLTDFEKAIWVSKARKYARQNVVTPHIRDASPSQWKQSFTEKHHNFFDNHFPHLLEHFDSPKIFSGTHYKPAPQKEAFPELIDPKRRKKS
ncbi:sulfotransferase domain-containing protein [Marinobacter sp. F4216]|uniref:sulfotransferase domain-containing protein n=1 Tax=Marinobacter sp. F4216 TaxID=2874281 RepID=UPI001CBA6C98|nr:sulfotransferase domain-containing protein [Marinobacter sp. F4216]MBZ2167694.1 sulfotransferase domain-containing protein [Marinobacter sp. F4216]